MDVRLEIAGPLRPITLAWPVHEPYNQLDSTFSILLSQERKTESMSLYPGVALITGAASGMFYCLDILLAPLICQGIGQATAVSFAREGCKKIAIADVNAEGLDETAKLMNEAATQGEIEILRKRTNVIAENEIDDLLDAVVEQLGRIDYCANCAGIGSQNKVCQWM